MKKLNTILVSSLVCCVLLQSGCVEVAKEYELSQMKLAQSASFPPFLTKWEEARFSRDMYGPLNPSFIALDCNDILDLRGQVCDISAMLTPSLHKGLSDVLMSVNESEHTWNIYDDALVYAKLQHHFPKYKGFIDPAVRLIAAEPNRVDFWFYPGHASLEQTYAAASEWCGRKGRMAVFDGGAVGCTPLATNTRQAELVRANNPGARSNQEMDMVNRTGNRISVRINAATLQQASRAAETIRDTRIVAAYSCR